MGGAISQSSFSWKDEEREVIYTSPCLGGNYRQQEVPDVREPGEDGRGPQDRRHCGAAHDGRRPRPLQQTAQSPQEQCQCIIKELMVHKKTFV